MLNPGPYYLTSCLAGLKERDEVRDKVKPMKQAEGSIDVVSHFILLEPKIPYSKA